MPGTKVERPWAVPAEAVAAALATDPVAGLTATEAADRLERIGPNELVERGRKPAWRLLAEQFANTMILVLVAAGLVTAVIGDLKDTVVILAIVVLNAVVGFVQEYRAEQAMAALKAMAAPSVQVVRDGYLRLASAAELVPGDLVLLAQGDVLAADLRLVEAVALRVNEAALTGESQPATKATEPLPEVDPSVVAERRNLAFRGTAVTGGRGRGGGRGHRHGHRAGAAGRAAPGPAAGPNPAAAAAGGAGTRERLERERPRVAEVAFDAARRRMTTMHPEEDGLRVATKGALDALLPLLDAGDAEAGRHAQEVASRWASQGYRVLALADRNLPAVPDPVEGAESDLHLLGLVAMADPARPESADAVAACQTAGIIPVMITGDDARTGTAIAERVGILDGGGQVLTGAEVGALDDDVLTERAPATRVYARTSPEQKLRIITAWKRQGAVVAMTGDGVNDAPALRRADIGVAMGVTGTDVSKEAADMVLADDNFATIVTAVQEGRRIYDNIRRFVRYVLTTNSGEIWVMFLATMLGLPVPLLPVQILWVNLVTDGLPAIALGLEPAERTTMRRPPRPPSGRSSLAGCGSTPCGSGSPWRSFV